MVLPPLSHGESTPYTMSGYRSIVCCAITSTTWGILKRCGCGIGTCAGPSCKKTRLPCFVMQGLCNGLMTFMPKE